ncbi:rhomboid family intramembrane serine protease [Imperialibacter roseus]|uniref:Rhomboid family intramembrane serine protease n=1 Tax=Imperialibacter roseus TaxID=1324217 RepID=A0ABZ0IWS8_9BACT|nr:rhomboid family intramembrane serine protease [Imperialibacter roseus]WOK08825.1 rhomboid family intramembrane serine protease [Imperialibacter roseus]
MNERKLFRESVFITLAFVGVLWCVKSWEYATSVDLSFLGIYPRTLKGSLGIVTSPFIHGDIQHLLSNTFPLAILGVGLFFFFRKIALEVFVIVYFSTGFWVWTTARPAFHIGASGIIYGLVSFLFFFGLIKRDARSLAVSMIVVFLYHGLFAGIFPFSDQISWESHLFGGLSGLFCAIHFRNKSVTEEALAVNQAIQHDDITEEGQANGGVEMPGAVADQVQIPPSLLIRFTNSTKNEEDAADDIISLH